MAFRFLSRFFKFLFFPAPDPLKSFEERLGYRFRDRAYLEQALRHRSFALSPGRPPLPSNERMEFLGDAVLGMVVSEFLYDRYPDKDEGELSKIKALVISRKALKEAADRVGLADHLILSESEEKSGGRQRFSINSNTFEALIAAIFADGGLVAAKAFIGRQVLHHLDQMLENESLINFKSQLLEYAQGKGEEAPQYSVTRESGPDHDKTFAVTVFVFGKSAGEGEGKTKKEAEQVAARHALDSLGGGL